jgi:hypothetical protein
MLFFDRLPSHPVRDLILLITSASVLILTGCDTITTNQYEATARATYVWQVQYSVNLGGDNPPRLERFDSTSLLNRNGDRPDQAVTGPDDQGLWWPALPSRPTVAQMEQRQRRSDEQISTPELLKNVEYALTYSAPGETRTLPTNYQVYRQAVRAHVDQRSLVLTLGVNNNSVQKAEPQ